MPVNDPMTITEERDKAMFNIQTMIVLVLGAVSMFMINRIASADVISYPQGARDAWFEDAGSIGTVETMTFTEHPIGLLTTQYQDSHGLVFSGNSVPHIHLSNLSFPNDGAGMLASTQGAVSVWLDFDRPMLAFAADFPGGFFVELFDDQGMIGSFTFGGSGSGNFRGLISTVPFRSLRLFDPDGAFGIDDLHFVAQVIPAPGAVVVLMAGAVFGRRRRRNPV
jgi:hypothetical protein